MSRENVEQTRRTYEAFNRRDWDAFITAMDEEVEVGSRLAAVEGGYRGHEGTRRWWDDSLGAFPDYLIDVEEMRDLGGDVVLVRYRARAHGATSATPLVDPAWQVIKWREGLCVAWRTYSTEDEALEAVGLRE